MSTSFGLIPLDGHPDQHLLTDLADESDYRDRCSAARSERAKKRLLKQESEAGFPSYARRERIAKTQARTTAALLEKIDISLREWREDDGPCRFKRIWASMAMCLEQAAATLQMIENPPAPVIVTSDDE